MRSDGSDRETLIAFAKGRLSCEESLRVLERIETDSELSRELEDVLLMVRETEAADRIREGDNHAGRVVRERAVQYVLRLAAVLVVALLSAVSVSEISKGRYHDLARAEDVNLAMRLRSDSEDRVGYARRMFMSGECDAAIQELECVMEIQPEGESMSGVHLIAGEMLLVSAEQSFMGLCPWYDEGHVMRAMNHLAAVLRSSDPRMVEEAHWLRMKGFLMLNDREGAICEGNKVIDTGRDRVGAAKKLLQQIASR